MEKNIFNADLNSLLGNDEPIDVDGLGDGYTSEIFDKSDDNKVEKDNIDEDKSDADDGLIDTDDVDTDTDNEEEEVDETEEKKEEPSSKGLKTEKSSPLTPYAKLLKEEGILPNMDLESFDGTADGLKSAMLEEIYAAVNIYKDSLPDRVKSLINNYEEGVPFEKLIELDSKETGLESITEDKLSEDTDLQKRIIRDYLKETTKFSDKKIDSMIDYYEDSGELEEEANTSFKELKTIVTTKKTEEKELAKQREATLQKQKQAEVAQLKKTVQETKEIIQGIPVNDKVRNAVLTSMTTPAGQDQYGNPVNRIVAARMEDPMGFEIKLHYLFELTKGFTDFSKLSEKGRKDTVKEFEDAVDQIDRSKSGDYGSGRGTSKAVNSAFIKSLEKTFKL